MGEKSLKQPVIIIGFGRSGTSIVADIILQHSELAFISNYNANYINSDAINYLRYLFDNPFWRIAGQKKQLNKVSILSRYAFKNTEAYNYLNSLTGKDFGRDFLFNVEAEGTKRKKIRNTFSKLVKKQGKNRLGFKITGPSRLGYLTSIFPDAKFILVKRQPLPNILSLLKVGFYQNRKDKLWWYGEGVYSDTEKQFAEDNKDRPELIAALQYFKINEVHDYEIKKYELEEQVLVIDYESFVKSPRQTIDNALRFAELKKDKYIDRFLETNKVFDMNKTVDFYFSEKVDNEVLKVANLGLREC